MAGADTVRFKAEVNFDGREVARAHIDRLNMESLLVVRLPIKEGGQEPLSTGMTQLGC